jgi:hypothetical protein
VLESECNGANEALHHRNERIIYEGSTTPSRRPEALSMHDSHIVEVSETEVTNQRLVQLE